MKVGIPLGFQVSARGRNRGRFKSKILSAAPFGRDMSIKKGQGKLLWYNGGHMLNNEFLNEIIDVVCNRVENMVKSILQAVHLYEL